MKVGEIDANKETKSRCADERIPSAFAVLEHSASAEIAGTVDGIDAQVVQTHKPIGFSAALPQPSSPVSMSASARLAEARYCAIDREKVALVSRLSREKTLDVAVEVAKRIADLHGKPNHADEVHAMADCLIVDETRRRQVKLAATLVVLGEWKSPAHIMLGGRLSDSEKRAHIVPINARAVELLKDLCECEGVASAIDGTKPDGLTPYFHACRDIAAMDAPRRWRQDAQHPDGRLNIDEMMVELEKNNARSGRNAGVTDEMLSRYRLSRTFA